MNVQNIAIDKIITKDSAIIGNVRTDRMDVGSLMESIQQHGLQQPVGAYLENEKYVLCWGHRRLEAYKKLDYKTIPSVIISHEMGEEEYKIRNITENLQRADISPGEYGRQFQDLKTSCLYSTMELASKFSIPRSTVESYINAYLITPEIYRNRLTQKGKKRKQTGLSASVANIIGHMALNKEEKNIMYEHAIKEALTLTELWVIANLLSSGLSLKEALIKQKEYVIKDVHCVLKRSEYEAIKMKNKKFSMRRLVHKLLREYNRNLVSSFFENR